MKNKLLTFLGLILGFTATGQLVNSGGTITIQSGAKLVVESDITNTSGSISNSGIIEVEGDFTNNGMLESTGVNSEIMFTGSGNSDFAAGNHTVNKVTLDKASGGTVTIVDNVTISDDIRFVADNNQFVLDGGHVTILKIANFTNNAMNADENNFFATVSDETVKATVGSTPITFPVGPSVTDYNPVTITENGTSDVYSVRVIPNPLSGGTTGNPLTSGAVQAAWEISEDVAGGSNMTVEAGWDNTSDELTDFDPTMSAVLRHDGTSYVTDGITFDAASVSGARSTNGNSGFVGFSESSVFIVGDDSFRDAIMLELKAFLSGPYDSASGLMGDQLRAQGLIPAMEPYDALAGFSHVNGNPGAMANVSDFDNTLNGDDVVDWVFVEVRDGTTPTTVVQTKSVLIQRDGDVVDTDGESAVTLNGLADGNYYVSLKHRNHLAIRTNSTYALSSTTSVVLNFSDGSSMPFGSDAQKDFGGTFGMWGGNAKSDDNYVRFTPRTFPPPSLASDRTYILDDILNGVTSATFTGYSTGDVNMDGFVRFTPRTFPPPAIPSDATYILDETLNGSTSATKQSNID